MAIITRMAEEGNKNMRKVYICSPYRDDPKKNIENAIRYCRMAEIYGKLPIAPHVYFTRVFPDETPRARQIGTLWGRDLMQYCREIWIFCNELTEGMIEEIAYAKKLKLRMKFYNTKMEEITNDNYLIHTEIGPAYRRVIAESYGDCFCPEGKCADCSACRRSKAGSGDSASGGDKTAGKGTAREKDYRGTCISWLFRFP